MKLPKIIFWGADAIALKLLEVLHREGAGHWRLHAVVSQPDRARGRGRHVQPNPIALYAREAGLPLLQPDKPDAALAEYVRGEGIDLGVVMAYGHILRRAHLRAHRLGMVNLHASLLPSYRGASPVETAICEGERETGLSLMSVIPRMDAGPVADTEAVAIHAGESAGALRTRLAHACVPLALRALPKLLSGGLEFKDQDDSRATYCRKLSKQDGSLDFAAPAAKLACRINGLDPWPGAFADHAGNRIKLRRALAGDTPADSLRAGTVLGVSADGWLQVATGCGVLRIAELQKPGGRMLAAADFLRGYPLKKGDCLCAGSMTELILKPTATVSHTQ